MFNLNENIQAWSQRLGEAEALSATDIQELETHLRASIAELTSKGLSEQEAFWLAERRLGNVESLAAEYARENPAILWGRRLCWMLLGYIVASTFLAGLKTAEGLAAIAAGVAGWSALTMSILAVLTNLLLCGLGFGAVYHLTRSRSATARQALLGWLRQHLVFILTFGVIACWLLGNLTMPLTARLINVSRLGEYFWVSTLFHLGYSLIFPLAMLKLMFWMRRQQRLNTHLV